MKFLGIYVFSGPPLPLFSLAALVHALHVRPSCYYKLLGGLTSLIANTDNSTILTQSLMSTAKARIWEIVSASTWNSFPPNRCFHLFGFNLLINTLLIERITTRCWINNTRCPVFHSCAYETTLSLPFMLRVCVCVYCIYVTTCVQPGASVCLGRYLWPIWAFVPSSAFLRWSMRLINVLCRGFPFTQGTPHGLFTFVSYWQQIPFPSLASEQIYTFRWSVHGH